MLLFKHFWQNYLPSFYPTCDPEKTSNQAFDYVNKCTYNFLFVDSCYEFSCVGQMVPNASWLLGDEALFILLEEVVRNAFPNLSLKIYQQNPHAEQQKLGCAFFAALGGWTSSMVFPSLKRWRFTTFMDSGTNQSYLGRWENQLIQFNHIS